MDDDIASFVSGSTAVKRPSMDDDIGAFVQGKPAKPVSSGPTFGIDLPPDPAIRARLVEGVQLGRVTPQELALYDAKYGQQTPPPQQAAPQGPAVGAGAGRGFVQPGMGEIPNRPGGGFVPPSYTPDQPESIWDKVKGGIETIASTVTAVPATLAGNVAGIYHTLTSGKFGTPEGVNEGEKVASDVAGKVQNWVTAGPMSQAGERYAGKVGEVANQVLVPLGPLTSETAMMAQKAAQIREVAGPVVGAAAADLKNSFTSSQAPAGSPPVEPLIKPRFKIVNGEVTQISQPLPEIRATEPVATGPVESGVPRGQQAQRAAVLQRIGLTDARSSAITGDLADAATNAQLAKYTSEPVGMAARAGLEEERQALVSHAERSIQSTGGTLGLDQDSLVARGQTQAAPFDSLRKWFSDAKNALYKTADERSGGLPSVQTVPIDELLADRTFNNSAMAQDKGHLVAAIKNQLDLFKENNPQGLTVQNAEQFNKWLNTNWSPDNSSIIRQVRAAVDDAVTKSAGEDVYGPARQLHQLEMKTLDDPKGISKLFDFDPHTPTNRATPIASIPDAISRLPPEQFKVLVDTLHDMPKEIRPQAQAAISEIQAHYGNKLLDAGANNKGQWNAKKVSDYYKANNANISSAFADNPEALSKFDDLRSAGHILDYPSSYPGASAQAANVIKKGAMSGLIQKLGATAGGGAGAAIGGIPGALVGAGIGHTAEKAASALSEGAALKKYQSSRVKLSDVAK
jgi:hypothetical protein